MDEKFEQRAAIKFCVKLKKSFTETRKMIDAGFGEGVVSRTTVYTWYKRFKDGRSSLSGPYTPSPAPAQSRRVAQASPDRCPATVK